MTEKYGPPRLIHTRFEYGHVTSSEAPTPEVLEAVRSVAEAIVKAMEDGLLTPIREVRL